jgi:4-hydroxy-3-polyprenylbenzoate decarboxylase
MSFENLQEFIAFLEKKTNLKRIKAEVDPILEMTEIADRIVKKGGPALLFEKVKGSSIPVLINTFGTFDRMAWALGLNSFSEIEKFLPEKLPKEMPTSIGAKIKALFKLRELSSLKPKIVANAPCQEVVKTGQSVDLSELPILKCWPKDGGRFITLPLIITKNQKSGLQNMGMYRLQVYDKNTTGMHWHIHHDGAQNFRESNPGKPFEVAVVLGGDPATIYAATAPLPRDIDEIHFAGLLRGKPVEIVKAKTVDLIVPAQAEIILEGYINHGETRMEGPFGDHTGYYSLPDEYPVFHINAITMKKDPVYPATVVGKPPMEDCYLGKATERLFLPIMKTVVPEIVDINLPVEGVFHNCAFVSIKKSYPRHAFKVMNAIWSLPQMMLTKFIIVVDSGVNVQNTSEVLWKVFNNVDPKRDSLITEGPLDVLDHSSSTPYYGFKMGLDATRKWKEEGCEREWPDDIEMSEEVKRLVDRRWSEYGLE